MVNAAWLDSAGFNIRGWLLRTNRNYVRDVSTASGGINSGETFTTPATYSAGNYFGFELGYDKNPTVGGASWTGLQYNGNIAGTVWKSVHDSGQIRKYDFSYDAVNRLTGADFNQYTGTGFNKNAGVDFSVSGLDYDANGNIMHMNQRGLKVNNTSDFIDQLTYTYISGTNKLQTVTDAANSNTPAPGSPDYLGDFHYASGAGTGATYAYDANGNLTSDANKNISSITYNYLNLPQVITVSGKGTISYTYDAAGNKLQKQTTEGSTVTTTLYIGGIVYQNDVLQFMAQEEGRIRINSSLTGYVFDYYLKDHLGNTRMTITDDNTAATPVIDATSYYPFGLTMAGISSKAAGKMENKLKYNGNELQNKEFSDGSGLEMYDMHYRQFDAQVGRWWQLDPMMEAHPNISPYGFVNDNPLSYCDPMGLDSVKTGTKNGENTATATNADGSTGTYVVDPNNPNQLVGTGMSGSSGNAEVVGHKNKSNGGGYNDFGISLLGLGAASGDAKMFSKNSWFNMSEWRSYSPKYFGNQYRSATAIKSAKGLAKNISNGFKVFGWGIGLYNETNILFNDNYSGGTKLVETGVNAVSTLGGIPGAAVGVGWELGRITTQTDWYNQNVRPSLQDAYRSMGFKIDGDPDLSLFNKIDTSPKQ